METISALNFLNNWADKIEEDLNSPDQLTRLDAQGKVEWCSERIAETLANLHYLESCYLLPSA